MGVLSAAKSASDKMLFKEDLDERGVPLSNLKSRVGGVPIEELSTTDCNSTDADMDPVKKARYTGNGYVNLVHTDEEVHPPQLSIEALRRALPKEVFVSSVVTPGYLGIGIERSCTLLYL